MALLSVVVRQAQYSGDRSITNEYRTYVTLTLDRCRTKTVAVKGHNPHWEQDYLFETQNTSRGLLIEVWRQDDYGHSSIGCYWLPLNMVRYSNEHTTGLWASLGSELTFEEGFAVKSTNATGHFLLYDARFEDPDERRSDHLTCDNENTDERHPHSIGARQTIESYSNSGSVPPVDHNYRHSDKWYKYENYRDQDGYRSSSSENMRSDLDYSYSEPSNPADRRSYYESSDKSDEKDTQYNQDYRSHEYYDTSNLSYDHGYQEDQYNTITDYKGPEFDNQAEVQEQWTSDEYTGEQGDELFYEKDRDFEGGEEGGYPASCNEDDEAELEDLDGEYEEVDEDDEDYFWSYEYNKNVCLPTAKKRILPKIPLQESRRLPKVPENSYPCNQYRDTKNYISEIYPRVPSIYVDSPTLSPCLSIGKGRTALEYRDQPSDNPTSDYQYSDSSTTAQSNQKTFSNSCSKTNSTRKYSVTRNDNDDYTSNDEEDCDNYNEYLTYDSYDYEDDAKSDDNRNVDAFHGDDDINNNQSISNRGTSGYAKTLYTHFDDVESSKEAHKPSRRKIFQERGKNATLTRQDETFGEPFEWTFNELSNEECEPYDVVPFSAHDSLERRTSSSSIHSGKHQTTGTYYKQFGDIIEEDYNEEEDDVPLVSPVNSSSLSQRSPNFASPDKEDTENYADKVDVIANSYHQNDRVKTPVSNDGEHASENPYRSPYKNSLVNVQSPLQPENGFDDQNRYLVQPEVGVLGVESRKSSLKEENTAEIRRQRARDRWHGAYNKIVHQLNVSTYTELR